MLSRIFVSLLILSALTSDGTVNLTEYLFGPYLYSNTGLVAVSEKKDTCLGKEKNDESSFSTVYDSSHITKVKNNYNKFNFNVFWLYFNYTLYQNIYTNFNSEISYWPLSFKKGKKIVLNSSDLSPPAM
ncbi:hypothetical protein [Acetivibrio saccincola]|jgi:hypothetical protein|uniref:Uncharacterized protein n=1 Tax=Acetivibrio saccincola TaxID=1677857 RepID=A0A2K9E386_9FIRM|nr:hypothetical protein [Acetivibrio saccincola]AUG58187.1 hypothetical protein HVS_11475 [Acetivibrio saccincola]NLW26689.1 hypothetical protein [Acetivibrio saccincola]PQQ68069.1 hypothetical protein B9R14_15685 [Acetivibrio saccincola]HOA96443.1 hypothetical protein [Acetivibrio saccincola]HQD27677.1 hypothetical protein [Acetivibrio saccincola]